MHKRFKAFIFFIFVLAAGTQLSYAAGNYSASVPVKDQSLASRDIVLVKAAAEVLRKVSGNKYITENSSIQKLLPHASEWVESYKYTISNVGAQSAYPWLFQVNFSPKKIDLVIKNFETSTAIQKAETNSVITPHLSLSNGNQSSTAITQKSTLLFLVINPENEKEYLLSETNSALSKEIKDRSSEKNLKVLLPLLDLEEQSAVNTKTILQVIEHGAIENNKANSNLIKIAQRYKPEIIIFGALFIKKEQPWQSQWLVSNQFEHDQKIINQGKAPTLAHTTYQHKERWKYSSSLLKNHLNFFVQNLSNLEHSQALLSSELVELHVNGIKNATDYEKAFHNLKNIPGILSVKPTIIASEEVIFNVRWNGPVSELQSLLQNNKFLQQKKVNLVTYNKPIVLFYSYT